MGQPTEYGDNILLQAIALHLKKPVQVFSYDSKDDTVYMKTMVCGILSKVETMETSSDRRRPCHVTMSVEEDHDWSFSCGSLLTNKVAQSVSFKFCSIWGPRLLFRRGKESLFCVPLSIELSWCRTEVSRISSIRHFRIRRCLVVVVKEIPCPGGGSPCFLVVLVP
jgi:hypothetical protein